MTTQIQGALAKDADFLLQAERGAANGVASLDSGGKVPVSELPASATGTLQYQGAWNASTNTPTLVSSTGTKGHYHVVSVDGSTSIDGISEWKANDWIVFNGTVWEKVDNTQLNLLTLANTWTLGQVFKGAYTIRATILAAELIDLNAIHGVATIARKEYHGQDSAGAAVTYGRDDHVALDDTPGGEEVRRDFWTMVGGTLAVRYTVAQGLYMAGATGSDKGPGTINCTGLFLNGTNILAKSNEWTATQSIRASFQVVPSGAAGAFNLGRSDTHGSGAQVGGITFLGKDSAAADEGYGSIAAYADDDTAGSEDGRIDFNTVVAGTSARRAHIKHGLIVGDPTGADKGDGAGNFENGVYDNNVRLANYTHPNHTGDVTSTGDGATVIGANKVTPAMLTKPDHAIIVAVGDETTAITTGTAKVTFRMPYAMTLSGVRASLTTASTSGIPTVDINESGATILSTKLTIDANEKTSQTAATAAVISDSALADDAEITIDIDVAGTGAKGLKVTLIGKHT